jgi:hypothetical protein
MARDAVVLARGGREEECVAVWVVTLRATERRVGSTQSEPARGGDVIKTAPAAPGERVVTSLAIGWEVLGDVIDALGPDIICLVACDAFGQESTVGATAIVGMTALT